MGFINPKKQEDNQLPGSGVEVDLETRMCPHCRREALPWEERCATCDAVPVPPEQVPAEDVPLPPGLAALADDLEDELTDDEPGRDASGPPGDEDPPAEHR